MIELRKAFRLDVCLAPPLEIKETPLGYRRRTLTPAHSKAWCWTRAASSRRTQARLATRSSSHLRRRHTG